MLHYPRQLDLSHLTTFIIRTYITTLDMWARIVVSCFFVDDFVFFFFLMIRRLPRSTLFPYMTLFRSLKKYRVLLINQRKPENREKHSPSLLQFCAEAGLQFTTQITLPELSRFRGQWKDGGISGGKKLERLRAVGRFFMDRGWWSENLALKLKRPKVKDAPTMSFTREEMSALLAACEQYTDWHGH